MKNSRNFEEKKAIYRELGWTVDEEGHATKREKFVMGDIKETRMITNDNKYDPWLPLPDDAQITADLPTDIDDVLYCQNINRRIATGEYIRHCDIRGNVPSAWIDYAQLERNNRLYQQAKEDAKAELRQLNLYRREGSRFVKI